MAETKSASNEPKKKPSPVGPNGRPRVIAVEFNEGSPSLQGYGPVGGLNVEINQGLSRGLEMEIGPNWTSVVARYMVDASVNRTAQVVIPMAKLKRVDIDPEWRG